MNHTEYHIARLYRAMIVLLRAFSILQILQQQQQQQLQMLIHRSHTLIHSLLALLRWINFVLLHLFSFVWASKGDKVKEWESLISSDCHRLKTTLLVRSLTNVSLLLPFDVQMWVFFVFIQTAVKAKLISYEIGRIQSQWFSVAVMWIIDQATKTSTIKHTRTEREKDRNVKECAFFCLLLATNNTLSAHCDAMCLKVNTHTEPKSSGKAHDLNNTQNHISLPLSFQHKHDRVRALIIRFEAVFCVLNVYNFANSASYLSIRSVHLIRSYLFIFFFFDLRSKRIPFFSFFYSFFFSFNKKFIQNRISLLYFYYFPLYTRYSSKNDVNEMWSVNVRYLISNT